eukprot:GHVU01182788.1.p1 GENE.GHVU01182788.1~~GHVU01182788.1.p1  ORF type:complete len:123 (+),score=0.19 GHVU01182788.1:173-541(+)
MQGSEGGHRRGQQPASDRSDRIYLRGRTTNIINNTSCLRYDDAARGTPARYADGSRTYRTNTAHHTFVHTTLAAHLQSNRGREAIPAMHDRLRVRACVQVGVASDSNSGASGGSPGLPPLRG